VPLTTAPAIAASGKQRSVHPLWLQDCMVVGVFGDDFTSAMDIWPRRLEAAAIVPRDARYDMTARSTLYLEGFPLRPDRMVVLRDHSNEKLSKIR